MAAIEIPPDYWTITPAGFAARAAVFVEQLHGIANDVAGGTLGVQPGYRDDTESAVALSDAAAPTISADAAGELGAVVTTPTGDVVGLYGYGDGLAAAADAATPAPDVTPQGPLPYPYTPGDPPPDQPPDTRRPDSPDQPSASPQETNDQAAAPAPPASEANTAAPAATLGPSFDDYTARMLECTGRPGSDYEWRTFWKDRADWYDGIYDSAEAQAYRDKLQADQAIADAGGFVTAADLAKHLANLDATIHILV